MSGAGRRPSLHLHLPVPVARAAAGLLGRLVLDADLSWDVQRRRLDRVVIPVPRGTDVTAGHRGGVTVEEITARAPLADRPPVTVVHFHGGGYCVGGPGQARAWAGALALATGARVLLPGYRLAPEAPWPAAADDARSVWDEVAAGGDPVVVSGDSAGGGLALGLVQDLVEAGAPTPAGVVLLSPWLDVAADRTVDQQRVRTERMLNPRWLDACSRAYAGATVRTARGLNPLHRSPAGLPPLLVQTGTDELLLPDSDRLVADARRAGVPVTYGRVPGMWHDFALQAGTLAAADRAMVATAAFVRRVTA